MAKTVLAKKEDNFELSSPRLLCLWRLSFFVSVYIFYIYQKKFRATYNVDEAVIIVTTAPLNQQKKDKI